MRRTSSTRWSRRALGAAATLVLAGTGCSAPEKSVESQFAEALTRRDASAAAALTTAPAAARPVIEQAFAGLKPRAAEFTVKSGEGGRFSLDVRWQLGADGGNAWDYSTEGSVVDRKVVWSPEVIIDDLQPNTTVRYTALDGTPGRIVDTRGETIYSEQVITVVNVVPPKADGNTPRRAAALLTRFDSSVTPATVQKAMDLNKTIALISLRPNDVLPIEKQLLTIPGIQLVDQKRLIAADRTLTSPVFGELTQIWQRTRDETGGWAVQRVGANGTVDPLTARPGREQPSIVTSINLSLQRKALRALATQAPKPAALVAIRPSDGALVSIAQNAAANRIGPIALTGLYPPGSTFKTITASAAMEQGLVQQNSVVDCPSRLTVGDRTIPNDDNFSLGKVPLRTAYANSCNTTMASLSARLEPNALQVTGHQFGVGRDYVVPGLTTVTGSIPINTTQAQKVESAIGQGRVTASPFGMVLTAATVAHGTTPIPYLLKNETTKADDAPAAAPPQVIAALRTMMRQTVTAGTATALAAIPGAMGKTGTAEYGDNTHSHGWFVGIKGDLAIAVLVVGGETSAPAVAIAREVLNATG